MITTQSGSVGFENLKIQCIIGVYPHERAHPQEILVDLKVASTITDTDLLEDTLDYVQLATICSSVAQEGKYKLLETYASKVLDEICNQLECEWAWIKVKKKAAIQDADFTTIELMRK